MDRPRAQDEASTIDEVFRAAVEREKLVALKEFAYGASHELNNPLANVAARAQALLTGESSPERRKSLAAIAAQAMRAHEMISDLMLFAKPPPLRKSLVDLAAVARRAVERMPEDIAARGKTIVDAPAPVWIDADPEQLAIVVAALVRNSLEAPATDQPREVVVRVLASEDGLSAVINVRDNGPGVSPAAHARIFDPFYSGREAGRGLGFGLPKCWRIVELHGGRIEVEQPGAGGMLVVASLPARLAP